LLSSARLRNYHGSPRPVKFEFYAARDTAI
jgi:hypothetical protein